MRVPFEEILLRTKASPIIDEKVFDMSLFKKTQALQEKYDIKYDPEKPVDIDGTLADRVYKAGLELFLDLGTYCVSTRRVVKISEAELAAEIDAAPESIELGQGNDRVTMAHRGGGQPATCCYS